MTSALYISTMWPPFGQGGEERTNLENFTILGELFDISILTTSQEVSPDYSRKESCVEDEGEILRLLQVCENVQFGENLNIFRSVMEELKPDVLLIGHPYGFGPELVDELKRRTELKVFFLGDITVYQDNRHGYFPADYFSGEYCIFVSDFTRRCLEAGWHTFLPETRQFRFDDDKCFIVHLSVDRQMEFADVSHFSICSLGRFDRVKGFDVLINSAHKHGYREQITLYGDGPYKPVYSQYVECPGWLETGEIMNALRQHSVFVFPSRFHETFGRTWLEAASIGLPLIIADIDVMKEIVSDELVIMYRRDDVDDLAHAVNRLRDPGLRREYQQKSLRLASAYSKERRRARLLDAMRHILAESGVANMTDV